MKKIKSKKFWVRLGVALLVIPLVFFFAIVGVLYWKQDTIVQNLVHDMNQDFEGEIKIKDSHISPFETFPYISIDLEHLEIFENKLKNTKPIVKISEVFLGFDIWKIVSGKTEIKDIKLKNGSLNLIQNLDGSLNIVNAFNTKTKIEDVNQEFHLNLKKIELENIDLTKLNKENNILIDALIYKADAKFKSVNGHVFTELISNFELNLLKDGDTTFLKHKHFDLNTSFDYSERNNIITIDPTTAKLEGSEFNLAGTIDLANEMFLDLNFYGNKRNFDLLIAVSPEELIPLLKQYDNNGDISFNVVVKGKSINGKTPAIDAKFKCENALIANNNVNKKLDNLNFNGSFTNGKKRNPSTMEFKLNDFSARPEIGEVKADLIVTNFEKPDIQLKLNTNFELEFLTKFLNIKNLNDLTGKVGLVMNFRDIIDINNPKLVIEKSNESYFSELKIEDLSFIIDNGKNTPVKNVNLLIKTIGHKASIEYCNLSVGNSDLSLNGTISDLPAILHHTNSPVDTRLSISSNFLDLFELTGSDSTKSIDEQIENLSLDFDFKSTAKALTESPNLPVGEFFIENLYAKLKHYPHSFRDFHADIMIDSQDMRLIDFKGMIDKSDFWFSGKLSHYDLWFEESMNGDTKVEFDIVSKHLRLEDLFSYKGQNYVPKEYRHEEFSQFKLHGHTELHFNKGLQSTDIYLDKLESKMKVHPLKFEKFMGRIHLEKDNLMIENLSGKIGNSDFTTTAHWFLGEDNEEKKRTNYLSFSSNKLDLDQLLNYETITSNNEKVNHDSVFNIYTLPFTDMSYNFNVGYLNYHKYKLTNASAKLRTTTNHYLYVDELNLTAADGEFDVTGYFNGSNPSLIYFNPNIKASNVNLEKFMLKFDNFGQDHLVSENLKGKFTGTITGKIHMHTDLTPKIDDSELHIDMHVTEGKLEHFEMLNALSDYFGDKNLTSVRFDTLDNKLDLVNGKLSIPSMDINSSLGHLMISGEQNTDLNFNYLVSVPWKVITKTASNKLFKKNKEEVDTEQIDEIQYENENKKTRYVNVRIKGNSEDYKVSLGKRNEK
jgi:hypothetical protein